LFVAGNDLNWYVIHTYSGYEERVRKTLELRRQSMDADGDIAQVVVPTEEEIKVHGGLKKTVTNKILPGYILVHNASGVTGFVSSGNKPVPLQPEEYERIMKQMTAESPKVKVGFKLGQSVRVTDGPFIDFIGAVDQIDQDKGRVKVLLSLFGRETPVELDFMQVEKL
jgi:transcriptional antiterminator NusG